MNETKPASSEATGAGHDVPHDRRDQIRSLLRLPDASAAVEAARLLLIEQPSVLNQRFVRQQVDKLATDVRGLRPLKVALLASFSIEFLHDALIALGFASGLRVTIYQSGFGQIRQEVLDPASGLYAFEPDVTVLAMEGEDALPELYGDFLTGAEEGSAVHEAADRFVQEVAMLGRTYRSRSGRPLLVHNLAQPVHKLAGIGDSRLAASQQATIAHVNLALARSLSEVVDTHVLDYAGVVARHGSRQWYDARMRLYARAPIAVTALPLLAREYLKYFRAFTGLTKKCLVLDLDNTLWGGIIGEDGLEGIQLGPNYPGNAFVEFQRVVQSLHRRGVILAIASKNNAADVQVVFNEHRAMRLRPELFSASEIHWGPKSESLVRISKSLAIGLEHVAFADDNPVECEQVRRELPMVTVIQLPKRPELYVDALLEEGLFDTLGLSDEDRRRGALYQQRALAEAMREESANLEDYYRSLQMELSIAPVDAGTLPRTSQLTQKTNQFNTTTHRYSEADISGRMASPDWLLHTVGVRDRFGDNGIVGVMMAEVSYDRLEIDSFLLSCRVIGRTVETAMLAHLCTEARHRGLRRLSGLIRPTAKNAPARDLFERHGFTKLGDGEDGSSSWELDLGSSDIAMPEWFKTEG